MRASFRRTIAASLAITTRLVTKACLQVSWPAHQRNSGNVAASALLVHFSHEQRATWIYAKIAAAFTTSGRRWSLDQQVPRAFNAMPLNLISQRRLLHVNDTRECKSSQNVESEQVVANCVPHREPINP
jgi:hypothetical protein